jgi:hypothetical protein
MLRFLSDWIGCFLALGQEIVYSWGTFVCLPLLLRGVRLIQIVWFFIGNLILRRGIGERCERFDFCL